MNCQSDYSFNLFDEKRLVEEIIPYRNERQNSDYIKRIYLVKPTISRIASENSAGTRYVILREKSQIENFY